MLEIRSRVGSFVRCLETTPHSGAVSTDYEPVVPGGFEAGTTAAGVSVAAGFTFGVPISEAVAAGVG